MFKRIFTISIKLKILILNVIQLWMEETFVILTEVNGEMFK